MLLRSNQGLISRVQSETDKRKTLLFLTEKAHALKGEYDSVSDEMGSIYYKDFSEEEITRFEECLDPVSYTHLDVYKRQDLINNQGLQINTLETINTVLRPTFQLAVRDDIIRKNPVDGADCEVKKRKGGARKTRRALTVDQQRKFMEYVAKNPFFYHWYPFFVFLLGTGCRIGEAIGLRWDAVSYTHLDVSKRQVQSSQYKGWRSWRALYLCGRWKGNIPFL